MRRRALRVVCGGMAVPEGQMDVRVLYAQGVHGAAQPPSPTPVTR